MTRLVAVLLALAPLLGTGGAPDESAASLLARAARKADASRYVGTRRVTVVERGKERVHEETITRDGLRSRVDFAPGSRYEGQTAIEGPEGRFLIDSRRREIRVLPSRIQENRRRIARFADLARRGKVLLSVANGGEVAGLATRRVVIATAAGRTLARLSIDPQSAVVLRRETLSPDGRGGSFVFTRFDPKARIAPGTFSVTRAGYRVIRPLDELRTASAKLGVVPLWLPESSGYRLEGVRVRKAGEAEVVASFYSGGGKRLTIFASTAPLPEPKTPSADSASPAQSGKPRGRSDVGYYAWRREGTNGVTYLGIVGEERPERLRALASAVVPAP